MILTHSFLRCNFIMDKNGEPKPLSKQEINVIIKTVVEKMANEGLRTICISSRNFVKSDPKCNEQLFTDEPDWEDEESIVTDMTCLAIVGIEDPVRDEVRTSHSLCSIV